MSFSIAELPPDLEEALQEKADREGKSLHDVTLEALRDGVRAFAKPSRRRDLRDLVGSWVDDPATDQALAEQRQVDPTAWR